MDDEELVARVRAGDLEAASTLLSRYQDVAFTTALRLVGEADAEDIAQDALVRAYTRLDDLDAEASFEAWLRRITVNLSLTALRRRGLLQFESLDARSASNETQPDAEGVAGLLRTAEDDALSSVFRDELDVLINKLPIEQRVAVVLRDMYGYDFAEVAQLQRCGLSAAKMRVRRGRDRLRSLLTEAHALSDRSSE